MQENILAIVGPTASGKTQLALTYAHKQNAEIISVDSRQVYKFLSVGTAKPRGEWCEGAYIVDGISHHLVDVQDPVERFSAANFVTLATQKIAEIRARGKSVKSARMKI